MQKSFLVAMYFCSPGVAVCCSVSHCAALCCSVLQCVAVCAMCCSVGTTRPSTLHHTATHCTTLQHTAPHCNTLQHTATYRDTLQSTAAHRFIDHGFHSCTFLFRNNENKQIYYIHRYAPIPYCNTLKIERCAKK